MFNPLSFLALGVLTFGYASAIERADRTLGAHGPTGISAFSATQSLSTQDFVGKRALTVQDPHCDTAPMIAASLSDDFAESRHDTWTQGDDLKIELWTSDLMGTWTLLHVGADGITCIVSSGFGWTDGMQVRDVLAATPLTS